MLLGLCALWVKGVKKFFFFLHFYAFQSILIRLRHTFFFENFREREAQNARERSEQDASAKRPSSPAVLAGTVEGPRSGSVS